MQMKTTVNKERLVGTFKTPSRIKSPMITKRCNVQGSTKPLKRTYSTESMDSDTDCVVTSLKVYIDLRPGQTCRSKEGGSCIFRWPVMGRDLLTIWDRIKIPRYSHKLMHRKGGPVNFKTVISARWWSKHAIPKKAEIAYSVGQLWEETEWAKTI